VSRLRFCNRHDRYPACICNVASVQPREQPQLAPNAAIDVTKLPATSDSFRSSHTAAAKEGIAPRAYPPELQEVLEEVSQS